MVAFTGLTLVVSFISWLSVLGSVEAKTALEAYTPTIGDCPAGFTLVREVSTTASGQTLSAGEQEYIKNRKALLPGAWKTYLANVKATNVELPSYVSDILTGSGNSTLPTFGIATSGGGYRAAIFGAGILNAIDARSEQQSGISGLLQTATYLAGLSGGSWFVGSLTQAGFPPLRNLIFGPSSKYSQPWDGDTYSGWLPQYGLLTPSSNPLVDAGYIATLVSETAGKFATGFPVTLNDIYARALARHFVNGTTASDIATFSLTKTHGAGVTWSGLASSIDSLVTHSQPFPIIISDIYSANGNYSTANGNFIPQANPILEYNLFETGSWDPSLAAFAPTQYLGTTPSSKCVQNFDQASFVMGSSSFLFNEYDPSQNPNISNIINTLEMLFPFPNIPLDGVAIPNPFKGVKPDTFIQSGTDYLTPVDGGEDGEVIPIQPLLVKARGVDVILAIDASGDNNDYANGDALISTQERVAYFPSSYSFPAVPQNVSVFLAQGLVTRPTFFGCDVDDVTSEDVPPLVIYIANGGPPRADPRPLTNISTTAESYPVDDIAAMLDQIQLIATQGIAPTNGSSTNSDPKWPACLACAVVDRERQRSGAARSGVCESCFAQYCWSG